MVGSGIFTWWVFSQKIIRRMSVTVHWLKSWTYDTFGSTVRLLFCRSWLWSDTTSGSRFLGVLSRRSSRLRISDFSSLFWMETCIDRSCCPVSLNLQLKDKIITILSVLRLVAQKPGSLILVLRKESCMLKSLVLMSSLLPCDSKPSSSWIPNSRFSSSQQQASKPRISTSFLRAACITLCVGGSPWLWA